MGPIASPPRRRPAEPFEMIDEAMAAILRAKTEAERLAIGFGMWRFARQLIEADERASNPDLPDEEIGRRVASRMSHGAV